MLRQSTELLVGIPKTVLDGLLHHHSDEPWTDGAVCVSVILGLCEGKTRSFADYARLWNWNVKSDDAGRKRVSRAWPEIIRNVLSWIMGSDRAVDSRENLIACIPDDWWELADINRPATDSTPERDVRQNVQTESESQVPVQAVPATRDDVEYVDDQQTLIIMLIERGIGRRLAEFLVVRYPGRILSQIKHLRHLTATGHAPTSPVAWLITAIQDSDRLPPEVAETT